MNSFYRLPKVIQWIIALIMAVVAVVFMGMCFEWSKGVVIFACGSLLSIFMLAYYHFNRRLQISFSHVTGF